MHPQTDLVRRHPRHALGVVVLLGGLCGAGLIAQTHGEPLTLSMVALDLEGAGAVPLRVGIERWTSDTEYQRLMTVLMTEGAEAFEVALNKTPRTGYFKTLDSLGWNLRLTRQTPGKDGGRDISIVTDRPIGVAESWSGSRSLQYPFTVIELHLPADGQGTGTLSLATKLIPDELNKLLIVENYGNQRIRLNQVKRE